MGVQRGGEERITGEENSKVHRKDWDLKGIVRQIIAEFCFQFCLHLL